MLPPRDTRARLRDRSARDIGSAHFAEEPLQFFEEVIVHNAVERLARAVVCGVCEQAEE
jgi:hypothetical protein